MTKIKAFFSWIFQFIIKSIAFVLFTPKVIYKNRDAIRKDGTPVLFICNHRSFYDGAVVAAFVHKKQQHTLSTAPCPLVAKDWFEHNWIMHFLLDLYGCMGINRFEMDTSWFSASREKLKSGISMLIFPEGKTSQDEMNPFMPGFSMLAERAQVKVVPCAIHASYKWFKNDMKIIVGEPYELVRPEGMRKSAYTRLAAVEAQQKVAALYDEVKAMAKEKQTV